MATASGIETALIVKASQIVEGKADCHCGQPAVLLVTSEPDGEPGTTCYKHAREWLDVSLSLVDRLFGPKAA